MRRQRGAFIQRLSWEQVEELLGAGAVALLPVGAACKQHGPHLPLNTDLVQAEWLAGALVRQRPVAVWPTLSYGHYPAFVAYPGSASLSAGTFRALAREVLEGILAVGPRGVMVLNTGLSTVDPLRHAVSELGDGAPARLVNVHDGVNYRARRRALETQRFGSHADEMETSVMLAIGPERVRMGAAVAWDAQGFERGPFNRTDPGRANFTPSGVYGDATRARRDKGLALLEAIVKDLLLVHDELANG